MVNCTLFVVIIVKCLSQVPAQQCGSIIGKQGAKIKEIRSGRLHHNLAQSPSPICFNIMTIVGIVITVTTFHPSLPLSRDLAGAQINVSQESLPDSNERTVEV